ncbi:MAG TPA: glycosyltransferase family 2 protein [Pirellulales bacterium]|jgi:glycosyltransferase involved in cell wall biosynthesis|nr:glycosyltransferase family 2 protein [Pirellulales bacterium]
MPVELLSPPVAETLRQPQGIEVTIVMPCLNEAETLERCIVKAQRAIRRHQLRAEVVIADNGSSDGSQAIAQRLGARVVPVPQKGYGNALRGGIEAARGKYVIMGDSDDSYDFSAIYPFVERLRGGCDLVMGNRFQGGIMPGAMPWKHRWIGNPVLTGIGRLFFHCPAGDFHCGLRGFSKEAFNRMELQTGGMEFASEMVIKSTLKGLRIAEVPTTLHKDGRSRPPHLRSWRDGWRHLRFMLLFSPRWMFLLPGFVCMLTGLIVSLALVAGPLEIAGVAFGVHTLLVAGFLSILGHQLLVFGLFTKKYAIVEGFHPPKRLLSMLPRWVNLELGVVAGLGLTLLGLGVLGAATWSWHGAGLGSLDPNVTMRSVIPAVVLLTLGIQTVFASFFLGIMSLRQKH